MRKLTGIAAAPGLAVGEVRMIPRRPAGITRSVQAPHQEKALYEAARILAKDELAAISERAQEADQDIFVFQQVMLDDAGLNRAVMEEIDSGAAAADAVERAGEVYAQRLREVEDAYISQRAADVYDVCRRVADILDGRPRERLYLTRPAIVLADEILPSDLITIDRELILGFVTGEGSAQGHAAIIARTMGIPAIVNAGPETLQVPEGALAALDGAAGEVYIAPDEATKARFLHRMGLARRRSLSLEKLKKLPCITRDGVQIQLMANCSSARDIALAMEAGAEGVGLLRSEFLFMSGQLPDEEAQYHFYADCLREAAGKPVTIRTFDIGADKEVAGISMEKEQNPALGLRGLRLSLEKAQLFDSQLAALLRAACCGRLKVMFPMVTGPEDFDLAMEAVGRARTRLEQQGVPYSDEVEWGVMIETPAAALQAEELAVRAAFFSIGTNDLTQYTLAADRVNPGVAKYYDPSSPAVLRLMDMTLAGARKYGRSVSVCGESAALPDMALRYARMGLRTLSMAATALLPVKDRVMESTVLGDEDT